MGLKWATIEDVTVAPRSSELVVVIDRQRRVVGKTLVFVDRFAPGERRNAGCDDLVVYPPADVSCPRLATVRPPRVLVRIGVQAAKYVDKADLIEHLGD